MSAEEIKVSIVTISYNQEKYIEDALKSFVTQKTDFSFEIIIADDQSSDGTQAIIKKYEKKYPHLFNNILRKKNVGAIPNLIDALSRTQGRYVALCEGDDYWTDETKLQKQFDFLEAHPDHSVCFHPVRVFFENSEKDDVIFPTRKDGFTTLELLKENFIQTNSVMYRKRDDYDDLARDVMPYDWYLHSYHAKDGKIGFINEVMSAYRRHADGMWWGTHKGKDELLKRHGVAIMALYFRQLGLYGSDTEHKNVITNHIVGHLGELMRVDRANGTTLLRESVAALSEYSDAFLEIMSDTLAGFYRNQIINGERIASLEKALVDKKNELKLIKESRRYRIAESAAHLKARLKPRRQ